jgi:hypothetical protein
MTLTLRSKITIRWTTAPGDMGYEGPRTMWLTGPGKTMSLRNAANFADALSQKIGSGTYRLVHYSCGGRDVSIRDIDEAVALADMCR